MKVRLIVAYFRVSTDRQGLRGLGMDAQRAAVEAYAVQTESEIIAVYCEAETATGKRDRPELKRAIAHARRTGARLVVAKLDRLARNVAFLSALMESGVDFVAADNPTANRLTIHILAAVAEDEARRISERTRAALAVYKQRGGKLGTHDPRCALNRSVSGRRGQRKGAEISRRRALEADCGVIDPIRGMRRQGLSLREIAARLNAMGCLTRTGRQWSARQIKRVLERTAG